MPAQAVEVSPAARVALAGRFDTIEHLPDSVRGVIIANELVDNLPMALAQKVEGGWRERWVDSQDDSLVFVDAPQAQRLERVRTARRWDSRQFENRESAQKPLSFKRQCADYVVDNSGSPEQTLHQVERIYTTLTQDLPA